jgi:hypothetical protein
MSSVKVYAAVKGRIQAATRLLEAIKSEDIRSKTAEKHCKIIMDALRGSVGLRPFEAADLSELVSNAGFGEANETAILTAIMECPDGGIGDAESESKRQNYRALCNYLPEGVWDACGADPDVLCDTAAMLGLRDPDEPTVAMMVFLCTYRGQGRRWVYQMPPDVGHSAFLAMKRAFKVRVGSADELREPLASLLPEDPETFQASHPEAYAMTFGDEPPIPCPIPVDDLVDLLKRFPQRMGRNKRAASASMSATTQLHRALDDCVDRLNVNPLARADAKRRLKDTSLPGLTFFGKFKEEESAVQSPYQRPSPAQRGCAAVWSASRPSPSMAPILDAPGGHVAGEAEAAPALSTPRARPTCSPQPAPSTALVKWRPTSSLGAYGDAYVPGGAAEAKEPSNPKVDATSQLEGPRRKSVLDVVAHIEEAHNNKKEDAKAAKAKDKEEHKAAKAKEKEEAKASKDKKNAQAGKSKIHAASSVRLRVKQPVSAKGGAKAAKKDSVEPKKAAVSARDWIGGSSEEDSDTEAGDDEPKVYPLLHHEKSRKQYLVRTGLTGSGQSHNIEYTNEHTRIHALRKARLMCRRMCRQRGLAVLEKFED